MLHSFVTSFVKRNSQFHFLPLTFSILSVILLDSCIVVVCCCLNTIYSLKFICEIFYTNLIKYLCKLSYIWHKKLPFFREKGVVGSKYSNKRSKSVVYWYKLKNGYKECVEVGRGLQHPKYFCKNKWKIHVRNCNIFT